MATLFSEAIDYSEAFGGRKLEPLKKWVRKAGLDVKTAEEAERFFFVLHTYFALLVKLLAWLVISRHLGVKLGTPSFADITFADGETLRRRLDEMESGGIFRREDDGSVRRDSLQVDHLLLAGRDRLSEAAWTKPEQLAAQARLKLVDLTEKDVVTGILSDFDLRNKAAGKVRFAMPNLEAETIRTILPQLSMERWLIVDGSLLFEPTLGQLSSGDQIKPVVGVAKNFRKDPQFVFGRGPRVKRRSIYKLLADLQAEQRTAAFSARDGKVIFWYVRLREQKHLGYPVMGVVKVELANPARVPAPSDLIDRIARALVAERQATPHGQDRRWHAHLYPIFLAERAVKEGLLSREAVEQFLKWR